MRVHWNHIIFKLAPILTIGLFVASYVYQQHKICKRVQINIEYQGNNFFLDNYSVRQLISADEQLLGTQMKDISLSWIEEVLLATNYVRDAKAFTDFNGSVMLNVVLKNPIARVYIEDGESFYLDRNFRKIPISEQYSARTLLLRGPFSEAPTPVDTLRDSTLQAIAPLVAAISDDPFLNAFISEIEVSPNREITMYGQVGDFRIHFGKPELYQQKIRNLQAFLKNVMNGDAWQYYKALNLKYTHQIIAVRR